MKRIGSVIVKKVSIKSKMAFLCIVIAANSYPQTKNYENQKDSYFSSMPDLVTINDSTVLDSLILSEIAKNHVPGIATCIVKNDEIIWKRCYGYANIEKSLMVNDSTSFPQASVTKPFTGTALMQLWEMGLFELDDNINTYLPAGASVINPHHPDRPISFRMLLTHTSSIKYNWENSYAPLVTLGDDTPISLDSFVVNYFTPGGTYFDSANYDIQAPGTIYEYSNEAVDLAGYLAGIMADTSFFDYCEDHIFKSLKLSHTGWFLSDLDTNNLAIQYAYEDGINYPIPYVSDPGYPSHLLKSSVTDLAQFILAYLNGGEINQARILESATIDSMNTVHYPQIASDIGLIWLLDYRNGSKVWWHKGGDWGIHNWISYIPDKKLGIIILSNVTQWESDLNKIYDALYQYGMYQTTEVKLSEITTPEGFFLSQNYPNPFNQFTRIEYGLSKAGHVRLIIYDLLGQQVKILEDSQKQSGHFQTTWDGTDDNMRPAAAGVYFCVMKVGEFVKVTKLFSVK